MKKYILLLLSAALMSSCSDLLDKKNLSAMGSDTVWEDPVLIESYVNNLYANYPAWDRNEADFTDESRNGYRTHTPWYVVKGEWGLEYNPMSYWAYGTARKTNEILQNIENVEMDASLKNRLKGETKFIRATAYFKMVIRYGGVPLLLKPQSFDSEDLYPARASIDEIFDFVTKEYAEAAELLANYKTHTATNAGRVTWGACKAMEGRAYLFWASPLYNSGDKESKLQKAADLCEEVIQCGLYDLVKDPRNIFLEDNSKETIFAIYYKKPERTHGLDAWVKPLSIANNDAAHWGPVQELVDAFPTLNGLSIDEDPSFDPQNPYDNRDPRLNAFIVVNGTQYCGRTQYNYYELGNVDSSFPTAEATRFKPWEKGGEFQDVGSHNSITGYLCRKPVQEDLPKSEYTYGYGSETPFIEIRLGEVYLNLAEALNELGQSEQACEQLEVIRQRAGLLNPEVPASQKGSQEALRNFIRNERYIELCFEQKRYWDLRRWKVATTQLGGKKFHGVHIYMNILPGSEDVINTDDYKKATIESQIDMLKKSWRYEYVEVDETPYVFQEKMYFMPIPRSDMETNPNLVQNEGW